MSFSNPRRRSLVAGPETKDNDGLALKTTMTLRKGVTFHSPTSPIASSDDTFVPPRMRRTQTHCDDVVDAHRRRVALTLDTIDKSLSKTEPSSSPAKQALRDTSIPLPRGFLSLPIVDPTMAKDETERRVLRPRSRRGGRHHDGDSGLGTSLESSKHDKHTSTKKSQNVSAVTRSAAGPSATSENLPGLSPRAVNRIREHLLEPLRAESSFKPFRPIILDIPRRIQDKEIICLRDVEKTLIFLAPERAKSATQYLDFCLASIRCVQATVEYLSDREQTRHNDRPYTNGYFIDLVDQIHAYAKDLARAREEGADAMDLDDHAEIKLFGGFRENGRPAELVRVSKDGQAVSLATGERVDLEADADGAVRVKRSLSQQREDEEEILRSMARRRKNAHPDEYAPKRCPQCDKEFKRPCDLTKHEKTHSRPWKCPHSTCKYHEYGWPTEKEMDRHMNDKHSTAPPMWRCKYAPCPYQSKRESNCKQHMEKAHGWTYVRTKTNGKKSPGKSSSVQQPTPQMPVMLTPSSIATPPEEHLPQFPMGMQLDFPAYEDLGNASYPPTIQDDFNSLELLSPHESNSPSEASLGYQQTFQDGPGFTVDSEEIYNVNIDDFDVNGLAGFYQVTQPKSLMQSQPVLQRPAPHISPIGQPQAMLYTPTSMVDEGFGEYADEQEMNGDFQLFPDPTSGNLGQNDNFFHDLPSAGMGFSQSNSQDMFQSQAQHLDWFSSQDFGHH